MGDKAPLGDDALADQSLDFLIQQAEADAKDGSSGGKQLAVAEQGELAARGQLQRLLMGRHPSSRSVRSAALGGTTGSR